MARLTIFGEEKEKVSFSNYNEVIEYGSQRYPEKVAFEIKRGLRVDRFTYSQIDLLSRKFGRFLNDQKLQKGDRILLWGSNSPEWVIGFFGAIRFGFVVVPVDLKTSNAVANRFITQTKPKILFVSKSVDFKPSASGRKLTIFPIEDLLPKIETLEKLTIVKISPDDLAEIIFTSGSTGFPKGVMIIHKNLSTSAEVLINYIPIFKRFTFTMLSVLPLSHIFEQVANLTLPWIFGFKVVYLERQNSLTIIKALKRHKVNGMFAVPQILKVLRLSMKRRLEREGYLPLFNLLLLVARFVPSTLTRRLLFTPIHNQLGSRLYFVVSGGAHLEPKVAKMWERMGILVFQGYGATETTALITFNFQGGAKITSVGRVMPTVQLRISDDGEVEVFGPQTSPGYWQNRKKTIETFKDGWYKTGDIGTIVRGGFLKLTGRAKFRIVLDDGHKVYPEDIEAKLNDHLNVKDSCVLGLTVGGRTVIHSVILTKHRGDLHRIVAEVNQELEPQQKILEYSAWPGEDFPRLRTMKVDRLRVQRIVEAGMGAELAKYQKEEEIVKTSQLEKLVSQVCQVPTEDISLEKQLVLDLKLDSLHRVELVSAIEEEFGVEIAESKITDVTTFGDLTKLVGKSEDQVMEKERKRNNWPRWSIIILLRFLIERTILFPYHAFFAQLEVYGRENLAAIHYPTIFYINHIGAMDMVAALRLIPISRRAKVIIAADSALWRQPIVGFLIELVTGTIPLVKKGEGIKESLDYVAEMIDNGYSFLIAPEGEVSPDGELQEFRPGTGLLAVDLGLQVVPIKISKNYRRVFPNLDRSPMELLPHSVPQKIKVKIGQPLKFEKGIGYQDATRLMYEAMEKL